VDGQVKNTALSVCICFMFALFLRSLKNYERNLLLTVSHNTAVCCVW
jgi:hypothetical protein